MFTSHAEGRPLCICIWTFANKFLRNGKTRSAQGPTWVRCTSARDSDAATLRRGPSGREPPGRARGERFARDAEPPAETPPGAREHRSPDLTCTAFRKPADGSCHFKIRPFAKMPVALTVWPSVLIALAIAT